MKTIIKNMVIACATLVASSAVAGPIYGGGKAGIDIDSNTDKSMIFGGIYGGMDLQENISVELEGTLLLNDPFDEVKSIDVSTSVYNFGGFGVYRLPMEKLYLKGKAGIGVSHVSVEAKRGGYSSKATKTSVGGAYGVGVGMNLTNQVRIEAELSDTTYSAGATMVSLGALVNF